MQPKITAEFFERLIDGKGPKYIRKGYLKFTSFEMEMFDDSTVITVIAEDGTRLATFTCGSLKGGQTLQFNIAEGYMKVKVA